MALDCSNQRLEFPAQSYRLRAEYQLVEVLPVVRLHGETGVHVLVDEHVVEHHDIR